MINLDCILNQIGKFQFKIENKGFIDETIGMLLKKDDVYQIELNCENSIAKEILTLQINRLQVIGNINNAAISCCDSYIKEIKINSQTSKIVVIPNEILLGIASYSDKYTSKIEATFPSLIKMFSRHPVTFGDEQDNKTILKYNADKKIVAKDDKLRIELYQDISISANIEKIVIKFIPMLVCKFHNSVSIKEAIESLFSVCNLISFFADRKITFKDVFIEIDNEEQKVECYLTLNYYKRVDDEMRPFYIVTHDIENCFQNIWQNWVQFKIDSEEIINLFYDIISDHCGSISCFLSLTRALEIYSRTYRDKEAQAAREKFIEQGKSIQLAHRLYDLIEKEKEILEIGASPIRTVALNLSDARNYYNHYNKTKYNVPTNNFIVSSNNFLRALLLTLIYERLGINKEVVKREFPKSNYSILDQNIKELSSKKIRKCETKS